MDFTEGVISKSKTLQQWICYSISVKLDLDLYTNLSPNDIISKYNLYIHHTTNRFAEVAFKT